jgi:hypothetical protein
LVTLDGRRLFALSLLRRLLVKFATTQLGQHARFFARTLKTAQGGIEIFIFTHSNAGHLNLNPLISKDFQKCPAQTGARILMIWDAKGKI